MQEVVHGEHTVAVVVSGVQAIPGYCHGRVRVVRVRGFVGAPGDQQAAVVEGQFLGHFQGCSTICQDHQIDCAVKFGRVGHRELSQQREATVVRPIAQHHVLPPKGPAHGVVHRDLAGTLCLQPLPRSVHILHAGADAPIGQPLRLNARGEPSGIGVGRKHPVKQRLIVRKKRGPRSSAKAVEFARCVELQGALVVAVDGQHPVAGLAQDSVQPIRHCPRRQGCPQARELVVVHRHFHQPHPEHMTRGHGKPCAWTRCAHLRDERQKI